ncbi:MAG: hypothetical protein IPJ46_13575 [Anaerolineales bacterium]|nr:hypothetical protein [Anaerolineales bacterium]
MASRRVRLYSRRNTSRRTAYPSSVVCHYPDRDTFRVAQHRILAHDHYPIIDAGAVPILATKADNRELDNRINRDMALLATEFDLPLWNFWAALSGLPDRGLYVMEGREEQGAVT